MGVVHLAQGPDGKRVALKVLRPAHRRRPRGPRAAGPRGELAAADLEPAHRRDPGRRPARPGAVRGDPLRARALALPPRRRGGPDRRRRPAALRRRPRRGAAGGALRRGAAPRHQADQRADGGALAGPDRLRPRPGGRGPAPDPDRLAAGHARLPRAGDPVRRRRDGRLRRARLGGDRGVRGDRPAAVRQGSGDGDHGPGPARRARPAPAYPPRSTGLLRECLAEEPLDRPAVLELRTLDRRAAPARAPGPRCPNPSSGRSRSRRGQTRRRRRCSSRSRRSRRSGRSRPTPVQPQPVQARPAQPAGAPRCNPDQSSRDRCSRDRRSRTSPGRCRRKPPAGPRSCYSCSASEP